MTRFEAWLCHLANLLVGGTGVVYVWLRYFAPRSDPFAVAHPALPFWQHAHLLAAPLLIFALGLLAKSHAWVGYCSGLPSRRRSGIALLAVAAPMILSGCLLQTTVDSGWRKIWIVVHLAASALWITATLAHQLQRASVER